MTEKQKEKKTRKQREKQETLRRKDARKSKRF